MQVSAGEIDLGTTWAEFLEALDSSAAEEKISDIRLLGVSSSKSFDYSIDGRKFVIRRCNQYFARVLQGEVVETTRGVAVRYKLVVLKSQVATLGVVFLLIMLANAIVLPMLYLAMVLLLKLGDTTSHGLMVIFGLLFLALPGQLLFRLGQGGDDELINFIKQIAKTPDETTSA